MLTLYLFVLFALPARLVVPGLGAAGRPAVIIGCGLTVLWLLMRMSTDEAGLRPLAVRKSIYAYLFTFLLVYLLGFARGLPAAEARGSDRALITTLSLLGVALVACDGISSWSRLNHLLRWLVVCASGMAALGAVQFFTGQNLVDSIRIPGLQLNRSLVGIGERGGPGFARVAGTASHYIEYGVVLALVVPIAVHLQLFAPTRRGRVAWAIAVGLLCACVPLSVSRAGTLALIVGLVLLGLAWRPSLQRRAAVVALTGVAVFQAAIPGLLGTIRSAFMNYENDPSIQNRRSDYAEVAQYIADRPWFGRGPGTFTPERYVLLDNQVLVSVLETGAIGTGMLVLLLLTAAFTARSVRLRAESDEAAHLGQVFAVIIVQAFVASLTFDSMAFATFSGVLFLVLGLCGSLRRLERQASPQGFARRLRCPRAARPAGSNGGLPRED